MAHSDETRANALAALRANAGDIEKTAKQMGIAPRTVRHWSEGEFSREGEEERIEQQTEALSDKLERLAVTLADAAFAKADGASLQQVTTSMAIAIDKMQLLREKPTNITGQYADTNERRARLDELLDRRGGDRTARTPRMGGDGTQPTIN